MVCFHQANEALAEGLTSQNMEALLQYPLECCCRCWSNIRNSSRGF